MTHLCAPDTQCVGDQITPRVGDWLLMAPRAALRRSLVAEIIDIVGHTRDPSLQAPPVDKVRGGRAVKLPHRCLPTDRPAARQGEENFLRNRQNRPITSPLNPQDAPQTTVVEWF